MRIVEIVGGVVAFVFLGCSAGPPDPNEGTSSVSSQAESLRLRRLCDGKPQFACPKAQYCSAIAPGHCPGPRTFGTCANEPQLCSDLFAPVCGCDGETYTNSCFAGAAGVAVEHAGACAAQGQVCGGIAGIACPGFGKCVDDPSDACDPKAGGADCSGICSCIDTVACKVGTHFNGDPKVCACVPDATQGQVCGGIAGIACPGFGKCVDDPSDSCDPNAGGADCSGIC
jgi:Kazal-type serine protease inhibitor domain